MAEVRWSLKASEDLREIENFIARDSSLHAVNFIDQLLLTVEKLTGFPLLGRIVPEFRRPDLRELIFRGYRIVYLVKMQGAIVLRVVHGARDLRALVRREPWNLA